jgi:hypothetical protein
VPLSAPRLERIVTLARSSARYESPAMAALRQALYDDLRALGPSRAVAARRRAS